jgi:SAM-dependent methyltransferase
MHAAASVLPAGDPTTWLMPSRDALAQIRDGLLKRLGGKNIRVYEAGGGSISFLSPDFLDKADVTVVDVDEDQLNNNRYAATKIRGDIQAQKFSPGSFDLIVCNYVIEHIERPDKALINFYTALAPNGIVFIAAPNPQSFSGFVTRYTPHWFHVWFYRVFLGSKTAGQPGSAPFPVVYHPLVSPRALLAFARKLGYRVVHFEQYESLQLSIVRQQYPFLGEPLNFVLRGLELLLRKPLRLGNFHVVLEKPAAQGPLDKSAAARGNAVERQRVPDFV